MKNVSIIGIAGGSCSGKTRLLKRLSTRLGPSLCTVMLQDDYYFSKPQAQKDNLQFNFDHPDAIDFERLGSDLLALKRGESVSSPRYDFVRHIRMQDEVKHVEPRPIVLVDGILILCSAHIRDAIDHAVFIRCDTQTRLQRRISRDVAERGRERSNVIAQFETQVEPMHRAFVSPSAQYADRVFEQDAMHDDEALDVMHAQCKRLMAG